MIENLSAIEEKIINKTYTKSRAGDVKHSLADITKAKRLLNYNPFFTFKDGLIEAYKYYQTIY
jgi:nucleoside-diphosphate-sugar epimerase